MRFAFMIMGDFDSTLDRAFIHNNQAMIVGVANIEEACSIAKKLLDDGVGCIELCGAFGEKGARKIIEATENKIPIGYVTHLKEQEEIHRKAFSNK